MKILLFDNYDSFTYNLYHLVKELTDGDVDVFRNDKISLKEIDKYDRIILSPGPGLPKESGILLSLIKEYASSKAILGVCLGEQAIAESFGGKLINMAKVYHGVATPIYITDKNNPLFQNIPDGFHAGRYHSWVVSNENFPKELTITARDEQGMVMALQHRTYDLCGVQFHPESILTPIGNKIIANWLHH